MASDPYAALIPTLDEIDDARASDGAGFALELMLQRLFNAALIALREEGLATTEIEEAFRRAPTIAAGYLDAATLAARQVPPTPRGLFIVMLLGFLASTEMSIDRAQQLTGAVREWSAAVLDGIDLGRSSMLLWGEDSGLFKQAAKHTARLQADRKGQTSAAKARVKKWHPAAEVILRNMCAADASVTNQAIAEVINENVSDAPGLRQILTWVGKIRRSQLELRRPPRRASTG